MSMFSKLMGKVFGKKDEEEETAPAAEGEAGVVGEEGAAAPEGETPAPAAAPAAPAPEPVDVTALLDEMNANHAEDLDWKKSIVDLMKLVGMDSSYKSRKELAIELGNADYSGTEDDNIGLHKVVLTKISENGGNVPADLLD